MSWTNKPIPEIVSKLIDGSILSKTSKIEKSIDFGWTTFGLQLLPHELAGGGNICPSSTKACRELCIYQAGNARFKPVNQARYDRTRLFFLERKTFIDILNAELLKLNALSVSTGKRIAVRLNMFSDIGWEKFIDMSDYHKLQFYDYTKVPTRMNKFVTGKLPSNYHLTFSYSGENMEQCKEYLSLGYNVSIAFTNVPDEYMGYRVINGDEHDLTFLQDNGVIIGLKYKKPTMGLRKINKFIIT